MRRSSGRRRCGCSGSSGKSMRDVAAVWGSRRSRCGGGRCRLTSTRAGRQGLTSDEREELRELQRENARPAGGARDPEEGRDFLRPGDRSTRDDLSADRGGESTASCSPGCACVLGVTRAGFYAWKRRPPSPRELRDRQLMNLIRRIHDGSRGTYGVPRIHAELEDDHGVRDRSQAGRQADAAGLRSRASPGAASGR